MTLLWQSDETLLDGSVALHTVPFDDANRREKGISLHLHDLASGAQQLKLAKAMQISFHLLELPVGGVFRI
jgi:hypothetical protein